MAKKKRGIFSLIVIFVMLIMPLVFVACDDGSGGSDEGSLYEVTFNLSGGSGDIGEQAVEDGDYADIPSDPVRPGYVFKGWYNGNKKWDFYSNRVYENTELVAAWEKDDSSWVSSEGLKFEATQGGYKVVGFEDNANVTSEVIIPKMYTGSNGDGIVTEVADGAFVAQTSITSVVLGGGVKVIGENAFSGVTISEIFIPKSVKTIKKGAFLNNLALETLTFEAGSELEEIGEEAFMGTGVTLLSVPQSVKVIGARAFKGAAIESLLFSENASLFSIGEAAFMETKVSVVNIPSGISEIHADAFKNCTSLTRVVLPTSLTKICNDAFYNTSFTGFYVYGTKSEFKTDLFDFRWNSSVEGHIYCYYYSQEDIGQPGTWYYYNNVPHLYVRNATITIDLSLANIDLTGKKIKFFGFSAGGGFATSEIGLTEGNKPDEFTVYLNVYNYEYFILCLFDEELEDDVCSVANADYRTDAIFSVINHILISGVDGTKLIVA